MKRKKKSLGKLPIMTSHLRTTGRRGEGKGMMTQEDFDDQHTAEGKGEKKTVRQRKQLMKKKEKAVENKIKEKQEE